MWGAAAVTVAAVLVTLLCARYFRVGIWQPVARRRLERFARRQSLAVTVAGGQLLIDYLATRRRWRGGGLLLSAVGSVALPVLVQVLGPPGLIRGNGFTVSFIALFAGWFAGAVVAEWRINVVVCGSHRSASLRPRRLAEYLPRGAWVLPAAMWLLLGLADLGGVAFLAAVHPGGLAPLILWTVADIAVAAVLLTAGRRVLVRSQRIASADVVQADDAIRSRSLHVLAGSALTVGGYLLTATVYALAPSSTVLADGVAGVLGVVCGLVLPLFGYLTATTISGPVRRRGPEPA